MSKCIQCNCDISSDQNMCNNCLEQKDYQYIYDLACNYLEIINKMLNEPNGSNELNGSINNAIKYFKLSIDKAQESKPRACCYKLLGETFLIRYQLEQYTPDIIQSINCFKEAIANGDNSCQELLDKAITIKEQYTKDKDVIIKKKQKIDRNTQIKINFVACFILTCLSYFRLIPILYITIISLTMVFISRKTFKKQGLNPEVIVLFGLITVIIVVIRIILFMTFYSQPFELPSFLGDFWKFINQWAPDY